MSLKQMQALDTASEVKQEPVRIMGFDCVCGRRMEVSAEQGVVPAPQRTEQELVAWADRVAWNKKVRDNLDSLLAQAGFQPDSSIRNSLGFLNFDAPPQRKPLTDEEMKKIWYAMQNIMGWYSFQEIARAIEAAHGIKENT